MARTKKSRKRTEEHRTVSDMGTEQTRAKLRPDPVDELAAYWRRREYREAGELEDAAREIRRIYNMTVEGMMPRAVDMHAVRGAPKPMPEWLAQAKRDRYNPWAKEMGADGRLSLVVDWLIQEVPLAQIDKDRKQRNGRASEIVVQALTRYAEIAGWIGMIVRRKAS